MLSAVALLPPHHPVKEVCREGVVGTYNMMDLTDFCGVWKTGVEDLVKLKPCSQWSFTSSSTESFPRVTKCSFGRTEVKAMSSKSMLMWSCINESHTEKTLKCLFSLCFPPTLPHFHFFKRILEYGFTHDCY